MKTRRGFWAALLLLLLAPPAATAFPIALLGTEGIRVLVTGADPVVAQYLGNSAGYSNDLYLMLDASGMPGDDGDLTNDMFVFNNHSSPIMSLMTLGVFEVGTELFFRLHVNNTGYDFYSGFGSDNPDGLAHARLQGDWLPGVALVSFEDLYGCPERPGGFNDLSFSFTNASTVVAVVPEPPTGWLLAVGVCGIVALRRFKPV